mgnify:CR=1 FL=1
MGVEKVTGLCNLTGGFARRYWTCSDRLMTQSIPMFLGGLALLVAGMVIGNESGTFPSWVESLHLEEVAGWVSTALLLAGIA